MTSTPDPPTKARFSSRSVYLLPLLSLLLLLARPLGADELEAKIARVTSGLNEGVAIAGEPLATMTLTERMEHHHVPGVSIALIEGYEIQWARGYGVLEAGKEKRVTPETLFQCASISKPVSAVGALALVEQGRWKLDDDINDSLKSWKLPVNEFNREKPVTLRGLLSHGAGITIHGFPGYAADADLATAVEVLNGQPPANTLPIRSDMVPGTAFRYSGGGYTIMQLAMTDVAGRAFPDILKETVLGPLGMKLSTYEQPLPESRADQAASAHGSSGRTIKGRWHTHPEMAAAGLWSTPTELSLFALEIMHSLAGKSNRVLSEEMTVEMLTPQIRNWGLGWTLGGRGESLQIKHGGQNAGFRCNLVAYPRQGKGVVIMTNGDGGGRLLIEILRSIAREYEWDHYKPTIREVADVDAAVFEEYAGRYRMEGSVDIFTISTSDGMIYFEHDSMPRNRLYPETASRFFALSNSLVLTFVRDENGKVTGAKLGRGGSVKARKL